MPHARLDINHVTWLADPLLAVQQDVQFAEEDVEGFLLVLVVLLRVLLSRQGYEELLAIAPIDHGEHGQAEFLELLQSVVVGNFQIDATWHGDPAALDQLLDLLGDVPDLLARVSALHIGGAQSLVFPNRC